MKIAETRADKPSGKHPEFRVVSLAAALGLTAMLFSILALVQYQVAEGGASSSPFFGLLGLASLLGFTGAIMASRMIASPRISSSPDRFLKASCIASSAFMALLPILNAISPVELAYAQAAMSALGWLFAGCALGLSFMLWVNVWNILYRREQPDKRKHVFWRQCLCLFAAMAASLALFLFFGSATAATIASCLSCIASNVLCWICTKAALPYELKIRCSDIVPYHAQDARPVEDRIRMLAFSACEGMIAVAIAASGFTGVGIWELLACVALAQAVLFALSLPNGKIAKIYYLEDIAFLVLSVSLLLMIAQNGVNAFVVGGFIISCYLGFTADFTCCILTMSLKKDPFSAFKAKNLFFSFLGVTSGWLFGCALTHLTDSAQLPVILGCVAMLLILTDFIFIPYPTLEDDELYEYLNGSLVAHEVSEPADNSAQYEAWWTDKCNAVGQEFGLTNRETEILALLAKGKNASSIAEQLFIAQNTARTHIYRIFRKMNVKNHQDLINYMEERASR